MSSRADAAAESMFGVRALTGVFAGSVKSSDAKGGTATLFWGVAGGASLPAGCFLNHPPIFLNAFEAAGDAKTAAVLGVGVSPVRVPALSDAGRGGLFGVLLCEAEVEALSLAAVTEDTVRDQRLPMEVGPPAETLSSSISAAASRLVAVEANGP